jgi:hypothetical protein
LEGVEGEAEDEEEEEDREDEDVGGKTERREEE